MSLLDYMLATEHSGGDNGTCWDISITPGPDFPGTQAQINLRFYRYADEAIEEIAMIHMGSDSAREIGLQLLHTGFAAGTPHEAYYDGEDIGELEQQHGEQ